MQTQVVIKEETKEIVSETSSIVFTAEEMDILDESGMKDAADLLGVIARTKKKIEDKRQFFAKPLNEQVKKINTLFKGYMKPLEDAEIILKNKVIKYRQKQKKKQEQEEQRLKELVEQEKIEVPVPSFKPQEKTVRSDMSTMSARKTWDFEIEDESQIPREYLMVDEKAIRKAVKSGIRSIPGVKIYEKEGLSIRS